MPQFHPDPPRVPADRQGELDVLTALRSLGRDIHVFYSLTLLDGRCNREREIDFLVLHPEWGLLILEVKGGKVGWDGDSWYREKDGQRKPMKEKPSEQLAQQQHRLRAYLQAQGLFVPEVTRILVLPHMDLEPGTRFGPDLPPERVIDRAGLQALLPSLKAAVAGGIPWNEWQATRTAQDHRVFAGRIEPLVEALLPSLLPPPSLAEMMAGEGQLQDAGNKAIVDHLASNFATGRFQVQGGPGSGKSLIGRMVARLWAAEGRRVLVLCYNKALKVANVVALDDLGERVTIATFHELLDVQLEGLGRPCKPGSGNLSGFFNETLPAAFAAALPEITERWDALLVDEAQDLAPEWVELLLPLLAHPDSDPVLLLGDPAQALYRKAAHTLGTPWRLGLNLRQHPSLRQAVWDAMPACGWPDPGAAVDPEIVQSRKSSPETWKRDLEVLLASLAGDGVQPGEVLVLLPHTPAGLGLRQDQKLGPWRIGIDKDWWDDSDRERLRVNTVHAFKGLEADLVIYLAPALKAANTPILRYVALSRARHRAVILERAVPEPVRIPEPREAPPPPKAPFDPRKALAGQLDSIHGALSAAKDWNRTKIPKPAAQEPVAVTGPDQVAIQEK